MQLAMLFPGQGSQEVGMGADLFEHEAIARQTFEEANALLGFSLSQLCFEGPIETLTETRNAQPALLVHSVAVLRVLQAMGVRPALVAGHSLGEYTALVAAGTLTFADALAAVRTRGELMYESGLRTPGAMAAVVGLQLDQVVSVCEAVRSRGVCDVANHNAPDQLVISGAVDAITAALPLLEQAGARVAKRLNVSGAFHSALMRDAAEQLANHLDTVHFADAAIPVITNVTGNAERAGEQLRNRAKEQIAAPVRWTDCMQTLTKAWSEGILEVGAGSVLRGLLRRIDRAVGCTVVGDCAGVAALKNRYREAAQAE